MNARKTIAQYCVDSKGEKDLAEQIAQQFERAGFSIHSTVFQSLAEFRFIGTDPKDGVVGFRAGIQRTETTLSELTKMVDELVGDEYDIVREWVMFWGNLEEPEFTEALEKFKKHREAKTTVTLDQLKAAYAKQEGIEVDKIVVKEETK